LANALRAIVEDLNHDAPGTTPTSQWLTPRAPSDRIDTVTMPRGSEKVLGKTVPRGTMKARVSPAAPPNVVLIRLVQLPVYWDRPQPSNKANSIAVAARKKDLELKGIRWGAGWCPRRRPRTHGDSI